MPDKSQKTEKATGKRRSDERKKGNVFKSQEVAMLVSLFVVFYAIKRWFPVIYANMKSFLITSIDNVYKVETFSNHDVMYLQNQIILLLAKCVGPLLLTAMVAGILPIGIQTKFLFAKKLLKPKFSKLNPIKGIQNMFSLRRVVDLLKNMLKFAILFAVVFQIIRGSIIEITRTMDMDIMMSMRYTLTKVMTMVRTVSMWFLAIAIFDFFYERWQHEENMKMTKQEVKDEYKEMEGDPKVKGKIRSIQRQRALSRMMQAVPTADVIIRNPTHYAVALKYDPDKNNAPVLVAKGQDAIALRIVKIGEENHVYTVENKPLARAIYASTEINREISPEFYGVVAELLVYVYKLNNKVFK